MPVRTERATFAPRRDPVQPSLAQNGDDWLFAGGPPRRLQTLLGLHPHAPRKSALAALIGWLPLVALSAGQTLFLQQGALSSFALDFAVHTRCLITVPLFFFAEALFAPRLGAIARHFLDAGLVTHQDRARFEAAVESTHRLRDSLLVEVAILALVAALLVLMVVSVPLTELPGWERSGAGGPLAYSPAGWWHLVVSLPLLLVLFLSWMWRLFLWARFLWLMSRLDLQLVPNHPDRAAGLMFIAYSLRACPVLGFALASIVAGAMANGVVHDGHPPMAYKYIIAGVTLVVVVLFSGPLLVFTGKLIRQWWRGVFEYGALATDFGQRFEHRWLRRIDDQALEAPDFSAATDLSSVVTNVYQMRLVPMDLKSLGPLVVATLLPFVPVLLMAAHLDTILKPMAQLLF